MKFIMSSKCLFIATLCALYAIGCAIGNLKKFPLLMPNVRPQVVDSYLCTSIKIDASSEYYVTAFEPNATMETAHHMLLYGCTEPGSLDETFYCGGMAKEAQISSAPVCKSGMQALYAWARNAPKLILPKDVGFQIGGKTDVQYLVLQVHYASVDKFKDGITDDSGVFVYYTKEKQPKSAGVLVIGSAGRILPRSTEFFETACQIKEEKVIHPFAFRVHTHGLGRVVSGFKVTPQKTGQMDWTLIGKKDPMLPQMFYPVNDKKLTLTNGDYVAARCTMESDRDHVTRVGTTNEDEMCNFYVMYWTDGPVLDMKLCFTLGPPWYYWHTNDLSDIPNEEASSLPVGQSAKEQGYNEAAF